MPGLTRFRNELVSDPNVTYVGLYVVEVATPRIDVTIEWYDA